jgi:phenylacetate-CoA ligase
MKEQDVLKMYRDTKYHSVLPTEILKQKQLQNLNKLLTHAYQNVPYYRFLLEQTSLVMDDKVELTHIGQMCKIPFLTKEIIHEQKERLYSSDITQRKSFKNTSGGSTGEPVTFMQDRYYQVKALASYYLAHSWRGADPYDSTIFLWGAVRDTFEGKKPLVSKVKDFLLNTITLNTFLLDSTTIKKYIGILNIRKPTVIIAYVESIYEMAKFIRTNTITVEPQKSIHAAAGTLHEFMRKEIEDVFQCKVFNHYGSREVGSIASECGIHDGLHILMDNVVVEVVNTHGELCRTGEEGAIVITTLNNYSMPLIRYKIGDLGILQEEHTCKCGCQYPKLQRVLGRVTDVFKKSDGSVIMPEYFIHLIGVVCNNGFIKTFQVIQEEIQYVIIKLVMEGSVSTNDLEEIEDKIKLVMGTECRIEFRFVDEILKTKTGKFLYTISKV